MYNIAASPNRRGAHFGRIAKSRGAAPIRRDSDNPVYGSSFWETAATQNCGHSQGISLKSLPEPAARLATDLTRNRPDRAQVMAWPAALRADGAD